MNAHSEASLQLIEDLARPTSHDTVLDYATGAGDVAFSFAGSVMSVEAADDRAEMLEEGGRLAGSSVSGVAFRLVDLYALPYDDGVFSLIVCRSGLHLLPEPVAALAERRGS